MAPLIRLRGVTKRYDDRPNPPSTLSTSTSSRPDHRDHGSVGRRQVDPAQSDRWPRPTHQGEIEVAGVRVDRLSEAGAARFRRTNVGFVFQFFHLLDDLSVADNIAVAALLAGTAPAEARERVDELLGQLGLADKARHFPCTLSGGERQRVAIARAIVNGPAVLLADEPTGALDRRNGEDALALLEDLNRRGQTIVLVTHDEQLAQGRAHRIIHLVDGAISGDRAARMVA